MRPRSSRPPTTSSNGASTACGTTSPYHVGGERRAAARRHHVAVRRAGESRLQLGELVIVIAAVVGPLLVPGTFEVVTVEQRLGLEEMLDPGVERGPASCRGARLAGHRPRQ